MKKHVYLAGPIQHARESAALAWRERFAHDAKLVHPDLVFKSPLRDIEHQYNEMTLDTVKGVSALHATPSAIVARDHSDVVNAGIVVANLLDMPDDHVSIGTCFEMAWCYGLHIPLVVIARKDNTTLYHPFVRMAAGWKVHTFSDALRIVIAFYDEGV